MTNERATVGVLPAIIRRWKMPADIAKRERAEDRIAQRVQYDVAIRMRNQPAIMGNSHAAQNNMAAGAERVNVDTLSDAHF